MELYDNDQAARLIGWHPGSLARSRVNGSGPPFLKAGRRVRYDPADVEAWLKARKRNSTSQVA